MGVEVGLVGLGARAQMLATLLSASGNSVVFWPGLRGERSVAEFRDGKQQLKALGAKVATKPELLARRVRLVLVALPASSMRESMSLFGDHLAGYHRLVHTMHGLEPDIGKRGSEILAEETPVRQLGALVGPIFDAGQGSPGAAVVGSCFPALINDVQSLCGGPLFRVYGNSDLVGVEVAGAMADIVAVAVGVADGLNLGPSVRGSLCARGVAEMGRLGVASGGAERTFSGIAGLGYLVSQTSGEGGKAYQIGRSLVSMESRDGFVQSHGVELERLVETSGAVLRMRGSLDAHITTQVHMMLSGERTVAESVRALLSLSQMME